MIDRARVLAGRAVLVPCLRISLSSAFPIHGLVRHEPSYMLPHCATMRANEPRLWLSSVAYVLMTALQRVGLPGTELACAQCDSIRLKLLKIGAQIKMTVRKVCIWLAESYPYRLIFERVHENLVRLAPIPLRC